MTPLSLYPLWGIDIIGSLTMIFLSLLCAQSAWKLHRRERENALCSYLAWFVTAILVFSIFRSVGHILKHLLLFSGNHVLWQQIAPVSGGLNTITFIVIFAVTLFFRSMFRIMERMQRDRKRIEQTSRQVLALNRNMEALITNRTQAELALQVAHEIRNPIMVIGGLLRRSMKNGNGPGELDEKRCGLVLQETEKLETLVNHFEAISNETKSIFQDCNLNRLIENTILRLKPEAERQGIKLLFQPAVVEPVLHCDPQTLANALHHILRNAIEACDYKCTVATYCRRKGNGFALTVRDNGKGISQEMLPHIFEPFFTTKSGATGLGLPYVKQVMEEHWGEVHISSNPMEGTSVTLHFPGRFERTIKNAT